jgi:phosphohistidine phosphatase
MMKQLSLYLVRHAVAAERGEAYPDDTLRPLTPKGKTKFREAVEGLARFEVAVDTILTSPLVRARQTADILAKGLSGSPPVVETEALRPEARFEQLLRAVSDHVKCQAIALVGHEPHIGATAARLLGASGPLSFGKGAVCRIDFDEWPPNGPGRLCWFATQKMLRKVAE